MQYNIEKRLTGNIPINSSVFTSLNPSLSKAEIDKQLFQQGGVIDTLGTYYYLPTLLGNAIHPVGIGFTLPQIWASFTLYQHFIDTAKLCWLKP
jgi:hypothetical protein